MKYLVALLSIFLSVSIYGQTVTLEDHKASFKPKDPVGLASFSKPFNVSDSVETNLFLKFNTVSEIDSIEVQLRDSVNTTLNLFKLKLDGGHSPGFSYQRTGNIVKVMIPPQWYQPGLSFDVKAVLTDNSEITFQP